MRSANTFFAVAKTASARTAECSRGGAVIWRPLILPVLAATLTAAAPAQAQEALPHPFRHWIDATAATEPEMQVQRYDEDTFVIRQSIKTNFEGPFLYLLFGQDRALLIDTGAGGLKIRPTIDALIDTWLSEHSRASIPLVVAHSHSHGDHHQGDGEFIDRPDTVVVGLKPEEVAGFFGISHWPDEIGTFDLGGRKLSIIPTPGHEPAHIMIYDPKTAILLSGDMLYPGRLYVPTDEFSVFIASADRLVAFKKAHPIRMLLGTHIEMTTTPGKDFPMNAPEHPDERVLELPPSAIDRLAAAVHRMADAPVVESEGDFIVYPRPPRQ